MFYIINENGIIFIKNSFSFVSMRAVEWILNSLKEDSLFFYLLLQNSWCVPKLYIKLWLICSFFDIKHFCIQNDITKLTHQSVWWSSITKSVLYLSFAEGTFALEPAATEFALWLKAGTFLEGDVGALMVVPCRTWIAKSGSWDGGAEPTSPCSSWRSCSSVSSPEKYVIHKNFNFN